MNCDDMVSLQNLSVIFVSSLHGSEAFGMKVECYQELKQAYLWLCHNMQQRK
jgi:hypothetical protein